MNTKITEKKLWVIFLFLLFITISIQLLKSNNNEIDEGELAAERLAAQWFEIIDKTKIEKNISYKQWENIKYGALLGKDFSATTTTLGSLEAKQTALNPKFSGLIYRWLKENNIDSTKCVGVIISGSFPSLAISTLAAIHIIKAKSIVISSIGASTYGANDPNATWLDYESWLMAKTSISISSEITTIGGENDVGDGMLDEGIEELKLAAERNSKNLYYPASLLESIETKTQFLLDKKISLLVNIGGNQAAIGSCSHSPILPNGVWKNYSVCNHLDRGILSRIYEKGITVIHLLNIRDLAVKHELPIGVN